MFIRGRPYSAHIIIDSENVTTSKDKNYYYTLVSLHVTAVIAGKSFYIVQ